MLHALRTHLFTLFTSFKEVNTPASMSFTNDTLYEVLPAIQITVECGSSNEEKEGNTDVISQRYCHPSDANNSS